MNQVFVCGTYFMIYVSMLKTLYRKNTDSKSLLILNDHTPGIENIIPALQQYGFFDHHLFVPFRKIEEEIKKETGAWGKIINRNKNVIRYVENNSDINQYADFIKASEFNLFYLWGLPSGYFITRYPNNFARIVEDGTRNYVLKTSKFKLFKRKYILNTFIGDGFDEAVKEIHVQYPDRLHERIRSKGMKLELRKMQDGLSAADKERVLNVFMKGQTLDLGDHKKVLVITQPLSEDRFTTEEYKLRLFTEIIDQYASDYQVYIKPHPRELTNYKETLHRDFIEIPRSFPLELLDLMNNITFDVGVTLFSSGLKNVTCIKNKVNLGPEYVKEMLPGKQILV